MPRVIELPKDEQSEAIAQCRMPLQVTDLDTEVHGEDFSIGPSPMASAVENADSSKKDWVGAQAIGYSPQKTS